MSICLYSEILIFWLVEKKSPRVTNIISPNNIKAKSREKVVRIKKLIT